MHRQQDIDYRRVARGIDYIAAHFRDGSELADIAAAAHLSPFHFQRLFTAWAGVSPKSFTRYLGLAHARTALRHGRSSLLEASLECGLSGPGRLHDRFVSIEGMTPGEYVCRGPRCHPSASSRHPFSDESMGGAAAYSAWGAGKLW